MAFTLNLHPTLPVYIDDKRLQFMHMAHSTHIITWHHCSSLFTCLSMDFNFFEWNPWFITVQYFWPVVDFWPVVCSYRKCRQLVINPSRPALSVSTNGINVLHSYQRCDENRYIHLQASINLASTHHHPSSGFLPISTGKSNLVIKEE